jgi:hypothetical protein
MFKDFGGYGPWKLGGSPSEMNMDPGADAKTTSDAIPCEDPYYQVWITQSQNTKTLRGMPTTLF